ncbi:MAG: insulinase family protein [Alphaproteobacteria bacterium]|nr:insulinase family protein [Alphaproteobacteria bacterium]
MKYWLILIGLLFTLSSSTTAQTRGIFNPKSMVLPNGLQIVLIENHLAPVVSICLIYKVGCADDPAEMRGLSHFLEHMMFKGTKDIPADQFKKIISSKGGSSNATTTQDYTAYTCDLSVEFLDFYLKLEADRMQNLVLDPQATIAEQKVVQEERLARLDNSPIGIVFEALLRSIYWYHPYGVPNIGYPQHIAAYTRDAAYEHYKKWYVPNNAILVVAGDVTMDTLKPMVEKHFGNIPSRPVPIRKRIPETNHGGVVITLEQENPRISQVNVHWNYAAPGHTGAKSEYYFPLILLTQILGGNSTSRLYKSLVEEQKLAVSADCNFENDGLDPETFAFSATLAPNTDLSLLKEAVQKHISNILNDGVTEVELADAKRDILAKLAFARDGNNTSVVAFLRLAVGFTIEQIEDWPNKINAVTLKQIHDAAKDVLGQNPVAILTIYPSGYKEKQKMKNGIPPSQKEANTPKKD